MEIYPALQFAMFLAAFCMGLAMGGLRALLLAARMLMGAYSPPAWMRARYARPLPLLRTCVRFERGGTRRAWCKLITFLTDVCFCLAFAISLILLLYRYNSGAWRLSVPVLSFAGFALFCAVYARAFARGNDYLAYFLAVAALYLRFALCLPVRLAWRILRRVLWRPACRVAARIREKRCAARTVALCRAELALAANGLLEERKEKNVQKEDHALGMDPAFSDHPAVLRGTVRGV